MKSYEIIYCTSIHLGSGENDNLTKKYKVVEEMETDQKGETKLRLKQEIEERSLS